MMMARGQLAYQKREKGYPWKDMGVKSAINSAKHYANRANMPWPPVITASKEEIHKLSTPTPLQAKREIYATKIIALKERMYSWQEIADKLGDTTAQRARAVAHRHCMRSGYSWPITRKALRSARIDANSRGDHKYVSEGLEAPSHITATQSGHKEEIPDRLKHLWAK